MNEFNAKQFYGYSPQNDPDLATTTKNFEFRYMRPEFLERAIQRVHKEQHITEKNVPESVQNYCPQRSTATNRHEPKMAAMQEDVAFHASHASTETEFVRDLSKQEIENLIRKVKTYVQNSPRTSTMPQNPQSPRQGNHQKALDHLSLDYADGQHSTTKGYSNISQSRQSPREVNQFEFDHIAFKDGQHSPNFIQADNRGPTTISPLRSPSGKCREIFRQFSQDKTYEDQQQEKQRSPTTVVHQYGLSNNTPVNVVSTATSPLISPRRGNCTNIQSLNQEESFAEITSCIKSPRNYPKVKLMSTATTPLTSPRRDTCGILRKLSQEEDLNKTYNLSAGNSNLNPNRTLHMVEYMKVSTSPAQVVQIFDNIRMEEYQKPQAKWVDILETTKEKREEYQLKDKATMSSLLKSPRTETIQNYEFYSKAKESEKPVHNQQLGMQNFLPTLLMTEVIKDNVRQAGSSVNVCGHGDYRQPVETVTLEDSDMEFEIMERPHYTKYIKSKPMPEEMLSLSADDEGGLAEFLEIESGINELDVRYLRNASPLSFTEITEDEQTLNKNQLKIYINGKHNQPIFRSTNPKEISEAPFTLSPSERCSSPSQTLKETKRRAKTLREQHLQRTFERLARGGSARDSPPCPSNSTTERLQQRSARSCRARTNHSSSPQAPRTAFGSCTDRAGQPKKDKPKSSGRRVLPTNLRTSKSIEDQKSEKTLIFQKMVDIQVKIVQVLDKLKISLLELNVPKNVFEKSKRQKNALEFAVRFSRNFLYPLKGLLEEFKLTPLEQFNSLFTNEACNRVCYIYNLLLQSLNTYLKQLRYFHLDHVPQKLPTLIEIIHTTTVLCLEKNIFSRQDERITFLQQSCNKFLDFLQELQDGHLNTARENYRKLTLEKASPKYELKMVMNPLNMYEPKLVPKVVAPITARKKPKSKRHLTSVAIDETKDEINEKPKDDKIPTHVQSYPVEAKSSDCLPTESTQQLNLGSGDGAIPGLDKSILQAMQHMTQEQVRTILEPILKTLSSALGDQNNPEMFEAIFNAFNSKVFSPLEADKQLNNDNKCSPENQTTIAETAPTETTATREAALLNRQAFDDVETTCEPLKVANQTKTQRQQNSRPTRATNKQNSANAITTTTATGNVAATAADIIVGDDDDDDSPTANHNISSNNDSNSNNNTNDHTKINANSLRQSSGNNNSSRQNSTGPDWRANRGELTHKPIGGELTTMAAVIINREESQINKTFKLMNEVVNEDTIDEKLPPEDKKQPHQQTTVIPHHTNKSQIILRTTKRAPKQNRDRLRRSRRQQPLNKFPCSSSSSFSGDSDDDEKHQMSQLRRSKKLTPSKFRKHQQQNHHSHHPPNNNILTSNKHDDSMLHFSQTLHQTQSQTTAVKQHLGKSSAHKNTAQQLKRNPARAATPPAPSVTPTSSRGLLLSANTDGSENEIEDHLLLRNMPRDLLKIQIPLTSSASAMMTGRRSDKQVGGEIMGDNYKIGRSASIADYGKMFKENPPLYTHKSPYGNSPDNTSRRLRPLPEKEMRKLKPKPTPSTPPKPAKPTKYTAEIDQSFAYENRSPRNNKFNTKPDLHIDDMIQERDRFLKLCEKNRFYNNPNFSEPWKIFSVISERVLNDMLDTVETDFNDGVSKFVEDFLELETKT